MSGDRAAAAAVVEKREKVASVSLLPSVVCRSELSRNECESRSAFDRVAVPATSTLRLQYVSGQVRFNVPPTVGRGLDPSVDWVGLGQQKWTHVQLWSHPTHTIGHCGVELRL